MIFEVLRRVFSSHKCSCCCSDAAAAVAADRNPVRPEQVHLRVSAGTREEGEQWACPIFLSFTLAL